MLASDMPSIYDIKPQFQACLRPLTRGLARAGITANQITVTAMLGSVGVGLALLSNPQKNSVLWLVPVWLFLRMALNAIDGMLAREHQQKSHLGALLNELGDVVSDAALYLPFAVREGFSAYAIVGIVFLAVLSEMTGVIGVQIGASRRYEGPMGKSDRAFVFGVVAIALACGLPPTTWLSTVEIAILILLVFTVGNRARAALREVS